MIASQLVARYATICKLATSRSQVCLGVCDKLSTEYLNGDKYIQACLSVEGGRIVMRSTQFSLHFGLCY